LVVVLVTALGLSTSGCLVVGFATGVAITDNREARLNARATYGEREACRARRKEQAFALTKTAVKAALSGDCVSTIEIEHQVRDLDATVHHAWFVRDDAIKVCLWSPRSSLSR
jgi:hypothetical protein